LGRLAVPGRTPDADAARRCFCSTFASLSRTARSSGLTVDGGRTSLLRSLAVAFMRVSRTTVGFGCSVRAMRSRGAIGAVRCSTMLISFSTWFDRSASSVEARFVAVFSRASFAPPRSLDSRMRSFSAARSASLRCRSRSSDDPRSAASRIRLCSLPAAMRAEKRERSIASPNGGCL